jgi:hypothetical protein
MVRTLNVARSVFLLGVVAIAAGCGADLGEGAFEGGEGEVGTIAEELGEAGCGTMACTSANSCADVNIVACGAASYGLSPTAYGSASCPGQYVIRDTTPPTNGGRIVPVFEWKGATRTAANCASARVDLTIYAKTSLISAPAPVLPTSSYVGVWSGTNCVMTGTSGGAYVPVNPNLQEVRVAGRATLGGVQQRINVGYRRLFC